MAMLGMEEGNISIHMQEIASLNETRKQTLKWNSHEQIQYHSLFIFFFLSSTCKFLSFRVWE